MRTPTSWKDKGLLEDDPLASAFLSRKMAQPSRGRRSVDWMKELARAIQRNPKDFAAAKQWVAYAFASEAIIQAFGAASAVHVSLDLLEIFVGFYWAWYTEGERAAQKVVNDERKRRGFGYRLPDMLQPEGSMGATAAAPAAAPRPPKPGHTRKSVGDVRTAKKGAKARPSASVSLGITPGPHAEGRDLHASSSSNRLVACHAPAGDISHGKGVQGGRSAVSSGSTGGVGTTTGTTRAVSVLSDLTELTDTDDELVPQPAADVVPVSASPTVRPSTSLGGSRSTTAVPDAAVATIPDPQTKHRNRNGKKARVERPAGSLRQRLPRGATNTERIASLAQAESRYYEQIKRTHPDDLEFDYLEEPVAAGVQVVASQKEPTRKKSKQSKEVPPALATVGHDVVPSAPEVLVDILEPMASTSAQPIPAGEGVVDVPNRDQPRRTRSKRDKKATAPSQRKKLKAPDNPERPPKRQRGRNGGHNAIGALNEAMAGQARPDAKLGHEHPRTAGSAPAGAASSLVDPASRKRGRSQQDAIVIEEDGERPPVERRVTKLPRRRSSRKRPRDIAPRVPPPDSLGVPATLQEGDQILQHAAAAGLLALRNELPTAAEWVDDVGAQDAPPSSDDEEDVPLSVALASKRRDVQVQDVPESSDEEDVPLSAQLAKRVRQPVPAISGVMHFPAHYASTNAFPFASSAELPSAVVPQANANAPTHKPQPQPPRPKQPLTTQPIIWAESRQEVCESFDWFRSYQGGVYFNNDMVKGYLLGGFSSDRDVFARDGRFIISHGGGRAESVHKKDRRHELHQAADQREEDKSVRALLRTYQMKRPLVLIIDDRYALFPYDLAAKGYTYVVLGFYHIANAWAERQSAGNGNGYVVRYKFAFEWCKKQPQPWWIPSPTGVPPSMDHVPAPTLLCPMCRKVSPLVYEQAWMCLQSNCAAFWTCMDGTPPPEKLTYDARFVDSSFHCDHGLLEDIAPLPPATGATDGVITSRRFCKGWHCKKCGRLSSRYKWEHWECKSCGATLEVSGKKRSPKEFWGQTNPEAFYTHRVSSDSGIIVSKLIAYRPENKSVGHYHKYILPYNRGCIYLILGNPLLNRTADEIFDEYQDQAHSGELRFRRWPLRMHQCRGTLLTNYFSQNTGEPYQYVGGTDNTVPFAGAPSAVVKARDLIHSRMTSVMQAESGYISEFNEVLSAAYMEKQKMAFHSDAERGLGPRVASLSLGSSALMHFRVLKRHREDKSSGMNQNVLTLFLRHGDVLIMDGAPIQEYYEHTVVPLNFRIAATARYIGAQ